MKFSIFGLSASVDIRPLPGVWVAELLGVVLGIQDNKISNFHCEYTSMAAKELQRLIILFLQHLFVDENK